MEDCKNQCWDELIPEVLGLIFINLSLEEKLTVIPRVCKSWRETLLGPYCWQEIDILEWSLHNDSRIIHRMLQILIPRSAGSLRKLCVSCLPDDSILSLIAEHGKSLHTLELPGSKISNSIVEQVAEKFPALTFLDLSFCTHITAPALEAIGMHCANLTGLRRVMLAPEAIKKSSRDDEALAIASRMRKLERLEIANLPINVESVVKILENCPRLEYLDVRGCTNARLDAKLIEKFSRVELIGVSGKEACSSFMALGVCYPRHAVYQQFVSRYFFS